MIRNGYVMHSATGKYDDADLAARPKFYGNTEYGRMNMKVITSPDISQSEWQLVYLPSLVDKASRPRGPSGHRGFAPVPGQAGVDPHRLAQSINWFMQATPFDNLGHEMPPKEMIGLMTFSFDLIIPAGQVLWTETYTATPRGRALPSRTGLACVTASRSLSVSGVAQRDECDGPGRTTAGARRVRPSKEEQRKWRST